MTQPVVGAHVLVAVLSGGGDQCWPNAVTRNIAAPMVSSGFEDGPQIKAIETGETAPPCRDSGSRGRVVASENEQTSAETF